MGQVEQLYRLQQLDNQLTEGKKRLVEVLNAQKEPVALQEARSKVESLTEQMSKGRANQKNQELELGSLSSKLKTAEDRLYSGNVRTPKELSDLQLSVQAMNRQKATLEEALLEVMSQVELLEAELTAARDILSQMEQEREEKLAKLKKEQLEIAMQVNDFSEQRQKQVGLITAANLNNYEAIRKAKGGVAVVLIKMNSCQGCQVTVPAGIVRQVNEGQLTHCGSCGRILCHA